MIKLAWPQGLVVKLVYLPAGSGDFYKGLTDNFDRRFDEHNKGKVSSTRRKLPLKPIHVEICTSRVKARRLKKFFKSGYGREVIKQLALGKWRNR